MTDTTFAGLPIKSLSIAHLIQQRDALMDRLRQAIALLHEAKDICDAAGISDGRRHRGIEWILQGPDRYRSTDLLNEDAIASIRKRADACAWNHLMHESGMRTLMDAKARAEWDERIEKYDVPELSAENVASTFGMMFDSRQDIFDRGVIQCFKNLSWHYKTNRPFKFGKRIVIEYLRNSVTGGKGTGLGWPNHGKCDQLDDLVRCFAVLDGKPQPDHRHGIYHLLYDDERRFQRDVEHDYFQIRSFRNGNGHLTFKRVDLVQKMNAIIARHFPAALPYDHHTETETV